MSVQACLLMEDGMSFNPNPGCEGPFIHSYVLKDFIRSFSPGVSVQKISFFLESLYDIGLNTKTAMRGKRVGGSRMWKCLAYIILALHVVCSAFVLMMPLVVPLGVWLSWPWVRDPWVRQMHLGLVLFIAAEVILRKPCPLMVWENRCRTRAGMPLYTTGFFDYWVERLLRIPFKDWMFESIFFAVGASSVAEYFLLGPIH